MGLSSGRQADQWRGSGLVRRSQGQSLVEFALIIVPFFLVFFSIVEFALITASVGSYNFSARMGARVGSVVGRTSSTVDQQIVAEVLAHEDGLVMAKPTEIDIFRANPNGNADTLCLDTTQLPSTPTAYPLGDSHCAEDVYLPPFQPVTQLTCNPCNWPVDSRDDSFLDADYLGVRVLYTYTYVTGFVAGFGTSLNLSTYSTQRIEPQDYNGRRHSTDPVRLALASPPAPARGAQLAVPASAPSEAWRPGRRAGTRSAA